MNKNNGDSKPHRLWWLLLLGGGGLALFAFMPNYNRPWIEDEDIDIALVQYSSNGEWSQWYALEVWNQGKSSKGNNQYVLTVNWENGGSTELDVGCYKNDEGDRECTGVDEDFRVFKIKELKH